jgi:hypothetical protein
VLLTRATRIARITVMRYSGAVLIGGLPCRPRSTSSRACAARRASSCSSGPRRPPFLGLVRSKWRQQAPAIQRSRQQASAGSAGFGKRAAHLSIAARCGRARGCASPTLQLTGARACRGLPSPADACRRDCRRLLLTRAAHQLLRDLLRQALRPAQRPALARRA